MSRLRFLVVVALFMAGVTPAAMAEVGHGSKGGVAYPEAENDWAWLPFVSPDICTQLETQGYSPAEVGERVGAALGQTCGALFACEAGDLQEDGSTLCATCPTVGSIGAFVVSQNESYFFADRQNASLCVLLGFDIAQISELYGTNLAAVCERHLDCLNAAPPINTPEPAPSPTPTPTISPTPTLLPPTSEPPPSEESPSDPSAPNLVLSAAAELLDNARAEARAVFNLLKKGKSTAKRQRALDRALSDLMTYMTAVQPYMATVNQIFDGESVTKAVKDIRAGLKRFKKDKKGATSTFRRGDKALKKLRAALGATGVDTPVAPPSSPPSTPPSSGGGNVVNVTWNKPQTENKLDCAVTFTPNGAKYGATMKCTFTHALQVSGSSTDIYLDTKVNGSQGGWGIATVTDGTKAINFDLCHGEVSCNDATKLFASVGGNNAILIEATGVSPWDLEYIGKLK